MQALLGFFTSPVALLTVVLMLVGAIMLLHSANKSLLRQTEGFLLELKRARRAHRTRVQDLRQLTASAVAGNTTQ